MVKAPPAPGGLALAGQRLHVATEVATWFLLLVLIEHYGIGTGIGYVGVEPSPLWFPIVWAALRGGLFAGVAAAFAAGVLHALGYAADAGLDASLLGARAVLWRLTLFGGVAFLVGQTRDAIDRDRLRQVRIAQNWKRKAKRQRRDIESLQLAVTELQRRIFDRSFDFQSVLSAMAHSSDRGSEQTVEVALGMLVDFCGATRCSALFVLPDGGFDLVAQRGWSSDEVRAARGRPPHERVLRAAVAARPVVALTEDDGQGGPVLVAPLADATGVIKAVLCVDDLPPTRFDQGTINTFLGVAAWVATGLRRDKTTDTAQQSGQALARALAAGRRIGTPQQLGERLFLEDARRSRHHVDLALVALRVQDARIAHEEHAAALERRVCAALDDAVRRSDDVYRFGVAGCYVLLLADCAAARAEQLAAALASRFDAATAEGAPDDAADRAVVDVAVFAPEDQPNLQAVLPQLTEHFFGPRVAGVPPRCPVPEPCAQRSGDARDFVDRLRLELDLAQRRGWALSLLDLRGGSGLGPLLARHLWTRLGAALRVTDGIYVLADDHCVVLLPCTPQAEAERVWQRLRDDLHHTVPEQPWRSVRARLLPLDRGGVRDSLARLLAPAAATAASTTAAAEPSPAPAAVAPRPARGLAQLMQHVTQLQALGARLRRHPSAADDSDVDAAADAGEGPR